MFKALARVTRRANTFFRILADPGARRVYQCDGTVMLYFELNVDWIKQLGIRTVLDIGSNMGAFISTVTVILPDAHVHAFEPQPEITAALKRRFAIARNVTIHELGLGDTDSTLTFYKTAEHVSSSFLPPNTVFDSLTQAPGQVQTMQVPVVRLDSVAQELDIQLPMLIKIDVQGFEDRVIRGGAATFQAASVVIMELSPVPQYAGALSYRQTIDLMDDLGFDYAGSIERVVTSVHGRIISEDGLFVNRAVAGSRGL
jgi:FkbM family methyltransferase